MLLVIAGIVVTWKDCTRLMTVLALSGATTLIYTRVFARDFGGGRLGLEFGAIGGPARYGRSHIAVAAVSALDRSHAEAFLPVAAGRYRRHPAWSLCGRQYGVAFRRYRAWPPTWLCCSCGLLRASGWPRWFWRHFSSPACWHSRRRPPSAAWRRTPSRIPRPCGRRCNPRSYAKCCCATAFDTPSPTRCSASGRDNSCLMNSRIRLENCGT